MWPETLGIKTYPILYNLGILAHFVIACLLCRARGIRVRFGLLLGACFAFGMGPGAMLLHDLLHGSLSWSRFSTIDGMMQGGLWGGPLAYLALAVPAAVWPRGHRRMRLDVAVLALPIPMILAKAACFANGCCWGEACDLPWAVAFPSGAEAPPGIPRHPTQLYEIVVLIAAGLALWRLDGPRWRGALLYWFVALYGVGRPLTEFFRGDGDRVPPPPLTLSQILCLAAAGVAIVAILKRRPRLGRPTKWAALVLCFACVGFTRINVHYSGEWVSPSKEFKIGLEGGRIYYCRLGQAGPAHSSGLSWGRAAHRCKWRTYPEYVRYASVGVWIIALPMWSPFVASAMLAAFLFWRDRRRHRPGCCRRCDYNLTGADHKRCPECGTPVPASEQERRASDP